MKTQLLIFISCIVVFAQKKTNLDFSYFGALKPSAFAIIPINVNYGISKNINVGLVSTFVNADEGSTREFQIGPKIEYEFGSLKAKPFIGLAFPWSNQQKGNVEEVGWQVKYAFGLRYQLVKTMFLKAEASNYRHNAGLSIWPSVGLGLNL